MKNIIQQRLWLWLLATGVLLFFLACQLSFNNDRERAASSIHSNKQAFELDPVLHPIGGRIVFNRKCADETLDHVQAYAKMGSQDGRAQTVVAVNVGYRTSSQGQGVHVRVDLERLKLNARKGWESVNYTVQLKGRHKQRAWKSQALDSYLGGKEGDMPGKIRFSTKKMGVDDWITFVENEDRVEDSNHFFNLPPDLYLRTSDMEVKSPQDKFDLELVLQNKSNGQVLELQGPRIRIPKRIWAMNPPVPCATCGPRKLGLLETLNPFQKGGLFHVLARALKYDKCIQERKAAKRSLGPYID